MQYVISLERGERGAKSAFLGFAQVKHLFKTAKSAGTGVSPVLSVFYSGGTPVGGASPTAARIIREGTSRIMRDKTGDIKPPLSCLTLFDGEPVQR
jgi:uncharacterized protein YegL